MKAVVMENDLKKILAFKTASLFSRYPNLGGMSPVRLVDADEPALPGPDWLKVRNSACGLCGTDVHFVFMDLSTTCFPAALPGIRKKYLGHELVGRVTEIGDRIDGLSTGDRVALRIDWASCRQLEIDPPCRQCARGAYTLCENVGLAESPVADPGGGFSPVMAMHRTQPFKIPDDLSDDRALLLEAAASSLHGLMKRPPQKGERMLIIGAGTIGLLAVALVKAIEPGVETACLARHPFQAALAEKLGADRVIMDSRNTYRDMAEASGGRHLKGYFGNEIILGGFDLVYDSVGSDRTVQNALRWARAGGAVVLVGINFHPGRIDYTPVWNQEVDFLGVNSHALDDRGEGSFEKAARLLAGMTVPVEEIITHRFPLDRFRDAVKAFINKKESKAVKIVIEH